MSMTETNVTQADRDAAASGYYAWIGNNRVIPQRMRDGEADDHSMVQAFARHRLARVSPATPEPAGELVEVLRSIAEMTDVETDFDGFQARAIARAALSRYAKGGA